MPSRGAQRRTTCLPCGFSTKGSVKEVSYKIKLHAKICELCKKDKDIVKHTNTPFDMTSAISNGYDGIQYNAIVRDKVATIIKDGTPNIVVFKNCMNTEKMQKVIKEEFDEDVTR